MDKFANDWLIATDAARDFAEAYLSQHDALRDATDEIMLASGAFGFVMKSLSAAQREQTYALYWKGIRGALEGNWMAEVESLRLTGKVFARAGATMRDWEQLSGALADVVRREMFRRFGTDLPRLAHALAVMQRFFERSLCVFSEAFLGAAQEHVQRSETLFRLTATGQAFIDSEGLIRKANDAFLRIYGLSRDGFYGRPFRALFDADDFARLSSTHREEWESTGRATYDALHQRVDGTTFPAHVEAVRLPSADGRSVWGISVYDLTEREQMEQLRHHTAELETENERVLRASHAKSAFLAQMSHELRTPLNAILGFSQLMLLGEVGPLSAEQLDFVTDIHSSGAHLLRVINDVLDLSKVEAGKLEFEVQPTDLLHVTHDVTQLSLAAAANGTPRIDVRIPDALKTVHLDPHRLKQVLFNYLSNALKFSPPQGCVVVSFAVEDERWFRLSVSDQGEGLRAEELARLFVPFEQLEAGRARHHDGTGLGLVVTKRLVEAQGGHVGAMSDLGAGTTFFAVLPRDAREQLGDHA